MWKKLSILLLGLLLILSALTFSSCQEERVAVSTNLTINSHFSGKRIVKCSFPSSVSQNTVNSEKLESTIKDYCPPEMKWEKKAEGDQLVYTFTLSFETKSEYTEKLTSILDKNVSVSFGKPDSDLASGWRLSEDFDGIEIVGFINKGLNEENNDMKLSFESDGDIVEMDGDVQNSVKSMLSVNTVEGLPVNNVIIETTNHKDGTYDRIMTLSVPQSTYSELGDSITAIMNQRVAAAEAEYATWKQQGNNMEFSVSYKGIDIEKLQNYTALFMDCAETQITYSDKENSSTPLAEQFLFEEKINTFAFVSKDGSLVNISYKYSLPLKTTYGEGLRLLNGVWGKEGDWIDGTYTLNSSDSAFVLRIPDGIQYKVKAINIITENNGGNNYLRRFDFVYDAETGKEAREYAYEFFSKIEGDFWVSKEATEQGIICRVSQEGTAHDISTQVGNLFGGGNFLTYNESYETLAVVTDVGFTDSINISYMLTDENKNVPMKYTINNKSEENLTSFTGTGQNANATSDLQLDADGGISITLNGGVNDFTYKATVPHQEGIRTYLVFTGLMVILAFALSVLFIRKSNKLRQIDKRREEMTKRARQEPPEVVSERAKPADYYKQLDE